MSAEWLRAVSPCDGEVTWEGPGAGAEDVDRAVRAAREAFTTWARRPQVEREGIVKTFGAIVQSRREALAGLICRATGKPRWEALQEADLLPSKVKASLAAQGDRLAMRELALEGYRGVLRHRPHGVAAVLGPFNLPAHLPHSHIVPAILAGNAVVFKPSEFAPAVGAFLAQAWREAGLPEGVLGLVQGGRETGRLLAAHAGLDALYFTGSYRAGLALSRAFAETPGKMLALELGGNNPLVVWDPDSIDAAAALIVQSAFLTAGQRCVCARRLVLPQGNLGDTVLYRLLEVVAALRVGLPDDAEEPFHGPVIHAQAARDLLAAQEALLAQGAEALHPMRRLARGECLLAPGLLDVTRMRQRPDEEYFGPLLQIVRVPDFEAALREANATAYGLAAGLISPRRDLWERFVVEVRAGVINWNRQITGASGMLPFGGIGRSGNHRPSAYAAADYCAYPVASLENERLLTGALPPGLVLP